MALETRWDNLTADFAFGHLISFGAIAGSIIGYLPGVAATVAFLWYAIQIYESKTVQRILRIRRTTRAWNKHKKTTFLVNPVMVQVELEQAEELLKAIAAKTAVELMVEADEVSLKLKMTAAKTAEDMKMLAEQVTQTLKNGSTNAAP